MSEVPSPYRRRLADISSLDRNQIDELCDENPNRAYGLLMWLEKQMLEPDSDQSMKVTMTKTFLKTCVAKDRHIQRAEAIKRENRERQAKFDRRYDQVRMEKFEKARNFDQKANYEIERGNQANEFKFELAAERGRIAQTHRERTQLRHKYIEEGGDKVRQQLASSLALMVPKPPPTSPTTGRERLPRLMAPLEQNADPEDQKVKLHSRFVNHQDRHQQLRDARTAEVRSRSQAHDAHSREVRMRVRQQCEDILARHIEKLGRSEKAIANAHRVQERRRNPRRAEAIRRLEQQWKVVPPPQQSEQKDDGDQDRMEGTSPTRSDEEENRNKDNDNNHTNDPDVESRQQQKQPAPPPKEEKSSNGGSSRPKPKKEKDDDTPDPMNDP